MASAARDSSWLRDYTLAFLNGVNPLAAIGENISDQAQQVPGPQIPTAPLPDRWYRKDVAHPLFPVPQQGASTDFGGMIIPNPDNLRVLPDTQSPADPLSRGVITADNFRGKAPLKTVSTGSQVDYDALAQQHGGDASVDYDALAAQHGAVGDSSAHQVQSAPSRLTENFLSGLGITDDEGAKNFFEHPINTMMGSFKGQGELAIKAKEAYDRGDYKHAVIHGLNYLVPFIGQQTDKAGEQLEQGDYAGGIGRTLGVAAPIVAGSPAARSTVNDVTSGISDIAKAATTRAATAAKNVTPKQAAVAGGTAGGAIFGHGATSAYFGSKLGHVAEVLLGKERANAPIFTKAASLDEAADAVAGVIARDREAQTQAGALSNLPATGAKPAAQTGEALATKPQSIDLTAKPQTPGGAPRFTVQDRAAAKSLLEDALKVHTGDVIDSAIPGKNAAVKARVDFYLKKGDVAGAESELDKGATRVDPDYQPFYRDPKPVPSTSEIRARVQADAAAPKAGTRADLMDDKAVDQQWQWHLERHGWAAESEARREFIARNSTGMTKGELAKRFAESRSGSGGETAPAQAGASGTAAADLTSILQNSLDAVRKPRAQK
ncbi:MAG: hypothetical protein JWO19_4430 [Bryobacterales bacterium]|nr:hypothetical protein [Bryobacterales bacterium]